MRRQVATGIAICLLGLAASGSSDSQIRQVASSVPLENPVREFRTAKTPRAGAAWDFAYGVQAEAGNYFVLDRERGTVLVFSPSGELTLSFGSMGQGIGEFARPNAIAAGGDMVVVSDDELSRLSVFDFEGHLQRVIPLPYRPQDVSVMNGRAYVAIRSTDTIALEVQLQGDANAIRPILTYSDNDRLSETSNFERMSDPHIASSSGRVSVALPASGLLAFIDLDLEDGLVLSIVEPSHREIDAYWQIFHSRSAQFGGGGRRLKPALFQVSILTTMTHLFSQLDPPLQEPM